MFGLRESGVSRSRTTTREERQVDLQTEGKWDQLRGKVKESWGDLTDDELDQTEGKWDQLVGLLKEKTGESKEAIEEKLNELSNRQ
jgi:uncharacterized protein YjbJ (UPF0337 family)